RTGWGGRGGRRRLWRIRRARRTSRRWDFGRRDRGLGECGGRRIRWPPRIRRPRRWQRGLNHIGRRQAWIALPFRAAFDMPNKDTRAVEVVALYALRAYRSAEAVEIEPDASTSR